jgi:hypothetical protein
MSTRSFSGTFMTRARAALEITNYRQAIDRWARLLGAGAVALSG